MTATSEETRIEGKLVVVFDMCSSSSIQDDLTSTNNLQAMRNLLIRTKNFLRQHAQRHGYEIYKFVGDGWILLFPTNHRGRDLILFLEELSNQFQEDLLELVTPILDSTPAILGLTFGMDCGPLVRLTMMGETEYIGRALNVACRLQSAIKDRDSKPQFKILLSKHTYVSLNLDSSFRKVQFVTRTLRNIRAGKRYECVKVWLRV